MDGNNKPSSILAEETMNKILDAVNESHLPAFVLELILKDVLNDIRNVARRQLERDKAQYKATTE